MSKQRVAGMTARIAQDGTLPPLVRSDELYQESTTSAPSEENSGPCSTLTRRLQPDGEQRVTVVDRATYFSLSPRSCEYVARSHVRQSEFDSNPPPLLVPYLFGPGRFIRRL